MLILLAIACVDEKFPVTFDWSYDTPKVAAIRVWPIVADGTVPRTIEALVIGKGTPTTKAELCGWSQTQSVAIVDPEEDLPCFEDPDLVTDLGALPVTWTPGPLLDGGCWEGYELYPAFAPHNHTGDTAVLPEMCASVPMLLVTAELGDAVGAAASTLAVTREPVALGLDPALADPRLVVVDGEVRAGGRVLVEFSVSPVWTDHQPLTDDATQHRWFVEAGRPWGTGITGSAGVDPDGRALARSWIALPDDHHGPLRVAVARLDPVPVWAELTLEVP